MKTYIIADNQFITNEGISTLLKRSLGAEIIIQAKSMNELHNELSAYPEAVVILDYTLFDFVSMEQMLIVKTAYPGSSWILFSDELGKHFIHHVLIMDPAISIIMKHDSKEQIINALQNATDNIPYICEYAEQILQSNIQPDTSIMMVKLTPSEKIILHEIALGKTTKEIAYEKNLSFHTVNSHRKNIFRKLEINNVHEAVKYAIRAGIFDVAEYYI